MATFFSDPDFGGFESEEDYCNHLLRSQKIQQLAWLIGCPPEIRQRKALELIDLIEQQQFQ